MDAITTQDFDEIAPVRESDPAVLEFVNRPDTCLSAMITTSLDAYPDRPALAWRPTRGGVLSDTFEFLSYKELGRRVRAVASTLVNDPAFAMKPGDPIGIMAFANIDFVTLNLAMGFSGLVVAPLQTTASMEALTELVKELEAPCLATSLNHLDAVVDLAVAAEPTRAILVFDHDGLDDSVRGAIAQARARLESAKPGCVVVPFSEAIARGAALPAAEPFVPGPGEDPLSLIFYTSGSTGTPKGVMYSEQRVKPSYCMAGKISPIVLHYQPLNHSYGMSFVAMAIAAGGTTCFTAKSDLSTLLEDMKIVRPSSLGLVPRVCELLYQRFHADYADEIARDETAAIERFREEVLGGRLKNVLVGSAALAGDLRAFIEKASGQTLMDSYGSTEVGGITMNHRILRPPIIDYKLLDVPELGYFATDKPHPRGELCLKTETLFLGYFARPDLTAQVIDEDGYYHTGDVMAEIEPDYLVYVDRTNNVMKLAQGEFVPVSMLETLYSANEAAISQIYLYGNSTRAFLLGVVVPNMNALPEGLSDQQIKAWILRAMERIAMENERHSYEVPRDVIIEHEPFSAENGLISGIGKILRPAFRDRYGDRLEAVYDEIAAEQDRELEELRRSGRDAPTLQTVCRAAAAVLGIDRIDSDPNASFAEQGGDSLSALSYSLLLEDIYGVPVEVGTIMDPSGSFGSLARQIDDLVSGFGGGRNARTVHGGNLSVLRALDLTLDKLIDADVLDGASDMPPPPNAEPECVLLTGATGFLGRFLCLEWLRRMERNGKGTLVCVARGADDEDARKRVLAGFEGGDGALAREIARLAEGRLTVLAGDIAAPRLGLDAASWQSLSEKVDLIVNPAAHVNHKLPYGQLFGANVAGTAELIGLALTTRKKRIVHASTVAASWNAGRHVDEDTDIREALPDWHAGETYADGYGASKWAAEVLLAEAHERFGLPITVFRSNMILAPTEFSGQLNVPDVFTRLVLSLALTGLAPRSFYTGDAAHAHYEGLPADFLAQAIIGIGESGREGHHTYHALNPNDDGISLDSFVDWMEAAGVPIERIADYGDWADRFATAMRALPEAQRNASVLPLIDAYRQPSPAVPAYRDPAPRFVEAVGRAEVGEHGQVPRLGPDLIAGYVRDLHATGLLTR